MIQSEGREPKILIVEDDLIISCLIEQFLKPKGYTIIDKVTTGEEAFLQAAKHQPDLILMDIGLAGKIDGITSTAFIHTLFSIPVIFLSGQDDEDTINRSIDVHPISFIIKPFNAKDLYSNIQIALLNDKARKKSKTFRYNILGEIIVASISHKTAFFIIDKKGRVMFMNPYSESFLKKTKDEVIMQELSRYLAFSIKGKKNPCHVFADVLRGSEIVGFKQNINGKLPNGTLSSIIIQQVDIKNEEGDLLGEIIRII